MDFKKLKKKLGKKVYQFSFEIEGQAQTIS